MEARARSSQPRHCLLRPTLVVLLTRRLDDVPSVCLCRMLLTIPECAWKRIYQAIKPVWHDAIALPQSACGGVWNSDR